MKYRIQRGAGAGKAREAKRVEKVAGWSPPRDSESRVAIDERGTPARGRILIMVLNTVDQEKVHQGGWEDPEQVDPLRLGHLLRGGQE